MCLLPVLILGQQHLLGSAIGSKHGQEDVGVGPRVLSVARDNRCLVKDLVSVCARVCVGG